MSVCGICVDNFSSEPEYEEMAVPSVDTYFASKYSEGVVATQCGHLFHYSCIKAWFQRTRIATCPFCNSTINLRSIIKLFHDWGLEKNEPISDKPTKAAFDILKENYRTTNNCLENTNRKLQAISGLLRNAQKKSTELQGNLSKEKVKCKEFERLFRAKELEFNEKHTSLLQALSCLKQVSMITSLPKGSSNYHHFPLSQGYSHNQVSIVQSVKKLREDYLKESKLCAEFRNKYFLELETHRKTRERTMIFQQLVTKTIRPLITRSQGSPDKISSLRLSIQELVGNSGLLSKGS